VDAAGTEFRAHGYHGMTMAAIAKRAEVAVQTVYFVFNTKLSLLAAIDHAVMGADELPPQGTPWWEESTTTAEGRHALEVFVANAARIEGGAALTGWQAASTTRDHRPWPTTTRWSAGFAQYVKSLMNADAAPDHDRRG
jgi:AcrR family transcriptional regulator